MTGMLGTSPGMNGAVPLARSLPVARTVARVRQP
jgi:hypothetical protein